MEKKSIKKNYILNLGYQILLLLTPLITTPYISRTLGADGIGDVSYAESIVSYFTLFATMGITTYGQREISYVQNSVEKRSIVFWNTKILSFVTSMVALLAYLMLSLFQDNTLIYLVLSLNIINVFLDVTWFFQGLEEFGKIVLLNTLFKFINVIYVFLFIKTKSDVAMYALGLALFTCLSNIFLWRYIPRYVEKIKKKDLHPFKNIKIVLSLFVPTIAIQVYTVLDKTMIGLITQNPFENGYYELALKISKMVLTIVTALGTVMIPRIGYHFENNENDEVLRLMYRGYRFVWFLGVPLCFGLVCVSSNFVPWFFGNGYEKVADLLKILAFLILAIGISNVTGMQYFIPTKRQNIFTLTVIIGAGVNFFLNIILIQLFQSSGAAIASVAAEYAIAISQLIIVRKEISPLKVLKQGIHYFIAGGIMGTILLFAEYRLEATIWNTICMVVVGGVLYLAVLLIMRDEFLLSNLKLLRGKFRMK